MGLRHGMNRRRVIWLTASLVFLAGVLLLIYRQFGPGPPPLQGPPGPRTIHLPADFVANARLSIRDWGSNDEWRGLSGDANGEVAVPAGKEVRLELLGPSFVNDLSFRDKLRLKLGLNATIAVTNDLSCLDALEPNDLQAVALRPWSGSIIATRNLALASKGGASLVLRNEEPDLARLARFRTMRELDVGDTPVTDAGLTHLKRLTALQLLRLDDTQISDKGMIRVGKLTSLRELRVGGTPVGDEGLALLKALSSLEILSLDRTRVTGKGLRNLAGFSSLRELHLRDLKNCDKGLVHLKGLSSLEVLSLARSDVTDAGLRHLAAFPALRELDLDNTKVGDAGVVHVMKMTGLRRLRIAGTRVTEKGHDAIRKALPECHVTW